MQLVNEGMGFLGLLPKARNPIPSLRATRITVQIQSKVVVQALKTFFFVADMKPTAMPGGRLELPTRGFSVL
jgi:hypothetical protein